MIDLNKDACTGCRMCVKVCPHGVLEMHENKATIAHEQKCIECGACQLNCRYQAIEVTKGTGCLSLIIRQDILKLPPEKCSCCGQN